MREKSGQHVLHVSFRRVPAVYTQRPPLRREVFVLDCPVPRMPEAVPVQTTAMSQPVRHGITRMTAPRKQHALLFVVCVLVWPKPWRGGCQTASHAEGENILWGIAKHRGESVRKA